MKQHIVISSGVLGSPLLSLRPEWWEVKQSSFLFLGVGGGVFVAVVEL